MMDRGTSKSRTVLFQNKFEKFVSLVGFSIRKYHDARSPERQIGLSLLQNIKNENDVNFNWSTYR